MSLLDRLTEDRDDVFEAASKPLGKQEVLDVIKDLKSASKKLYGLFSRSYRGSDSSHSSDISDAMEHVTDAHKVLDKLADKLNY